MNTKSFGLVLVLFQYCVFVEVLCANDYDVIGQNVTKEELLGVLNEFGYVDYEIITDQEKAGVSDLLDLLHDNQPRDYDYKISDGDGFLEEASESTEQRELLYPDIDYEEIEQIYAGEDLVKEEGDLHEDESYTERVHEEEKTNKVVVPVIVEYEYEIIETKDLIEIVSDGEDTDLDYQEDENYKRYVKKAFDTSVQFESIYQEQRIFNIILLSGVSLICLIVIFGLVSLAISIFAKANRHSPVISDGQVRLVKADGIIKSYAKIPVEVKNMLPSHVAYKQLYDV